MEPIEKYRRMHSSQNWMRYAQHPAGIVVMLLEGAMVSIAASIQHSQAKRAAERIEAAAKAIQIIETGLRPMLVPPPEPDNRIGLDVLYQYITARLALAAEKDQVRTLEEVYELLKGMKAAWNGAA